MVRKENKQLAGCVILYNPDCDVPANVSSYINYVDHLFVVDNQNRAIIAERIFELAPNKVEIITNPENEGIAHPLNIVLSLSKRSFDWLLTMDQDSRFFQGSMAIYRKEIESFPWENTFCLGPTMKMSAVMDFRQKRERNGGCSWRRVPRMMTSGSVISVRKALEIGGFDERLFIDEVDYEICYRAVGAGFSLFQSSDVFLSHQLGNPIVWHTIFGTVRTLNHSPFRRYYIGRNRVDVWKRFHKTNEWFFFRSYILVSILEMIKIIFMEKDKMKKISFFFSGVLDAIKGRMGKRTWK